MKNFEDLLNQTQQDQQNKIVYPSLGQLKQQTYFDKAKKITIKITVPIALSLVTAPFTTVSTLLQITNKPLINNIQNKLKLFDQKDPIVKHIKNGIFGDKKPYQAFEFRNYFDALKQMGKQGVKGFYKGNLTGIIYLGINSKLRTQLYGRTSDYLLTQKQKQERHFLKEILITIATCTITDLITLPLMFCQSRLILQNSLSNYRVYSSAVDIFKKVSLKNMFTGSILLLFKNTLFSIAWLQFINDSPAYSFILSTILSHIVTYPFVTVLRQMQTNAPNTIMMNDRKQNIIQATKRIWRTLGIRGFYRGFIGYGIVHFFMGTIMLQQNLRTGYFDQVK